MSINNAQRVDFRVIARDSKLAPHEILVTAQRLGVFPPDARLVVASLADPPPEGMNYVGVIVSGIGDNAVFLPVGIETRHRA